ncbi:transposase [Streptomyces sp. NPDC048277]|uniref:transposase n=1 Tax=Streptomyces sp. NPDC048277 TaxID=3155027 RepID=UPI0033F03FAF
MRYRAVCEVRTTGRPVAHGARDLGSRKEALRGWVRQGETGHGERDDRLTTAEREERKRLREENAELERANEILGVFCPGHRPSPDEAEQVIDHLRDNGLGGRSRLSGAGPVAVDVFRPQEAAVAGAPATRRTAHASDRGDPG